MNFKFFISSEDPDYSWEQAVVFVKGLKTSERKNCRGTYLAQLELFKRLKKAEDGSIGNKGHIDSRNQHM